jgi:hypothetical protein
VGLPLLALCSASPSSAQQVTLPLPEYQALRARAFPQPPAPLRPPVPVAVEEAALRVVVGEASAQVRQTLTVTLYGEGWQAVPLPASGGYTGVLSDGLAGRLEEGKEGWTLLLRGSGRHRVELDSVVPLVREESATRPTWRLALALPRAAVVAGTVEAPAAVREVFAGTAGLLSPDGPGRWSFVAAPGEALDLTLTAEAAAPERSRLPLGFEATTASSLTLTRTRRQLAAWIDLRVQQGQLERLEVSLPDGYEVISVGGAALAGWDVRDGALQVAPLSPVTGSLSLAIQLTAEPAEELPAPLLLPRGAARTVAAIKAAANGDGLLEVTDPGGARAPDPREAERLPAPFRAAPGQPFLLAEGGAPPRLAVTWSQGAEVLAAQVDRLLLDVLVGDSGRAFYQLWAEVRSTGIADLRLALPGAELVEAERDGAPVAVGRSGEAWVVPVTAGTGRQVLFFSGLLPLPLPAGDGELALPLPALSAPVAQVEVRVQVAGGWSAALAEAARLGAVGRPPAAAAPGELPSLAQQTVGRLSAAGATARDFLPAMAGAAVVEARWSALSPAPEPLRLRLARRSPRKEWL